MPSDKNKPSSKPPIRDLSEKRVEKDQADQVKGGRAPQRPRPAEPAG